MIPKHDQMYKEFLEVLKDEKEQNINDIRNSLATKFALTKEELNEMLPSGSQTLFANRVGWTRTYLYKAKLIKKIKRGIYQITDLGIEALNSNETIDNEYLNQFEEFKEFIHSNNKQEETKEITKNTPEDLIQIAIEENEAFLINELTKKILQIHPKSFEQLVLQLLGKMGYAFDRDSLIHTNYVNDKGIDGIVKEDKLGFSKIYIQAKRYTNINVGRPELQQFLGAVISEGGSKGLFITSSDFTKDAKEFSKKQNNINLVLINGEELAKLMIKYNLGVNIEHSFELKKIDNDYFEEF